MDTKPKLDDLRSSVWRLFITAQVKLLDLIEAKFSQAGLPPMEWYDVLLTLKEAPEYRLRLRDLAEKGLQCSWDTSNQPQTISPLSTTL